jgi:radical SAM protein with 4Fe4S-binding SPASM domain
MSVLGDVNYKAQQEQIPLKVHIDLTYRCHQRCIHCYIPESWRRGQGPGPELSTLKVKNILDQLAAAGTFFLTFSGGEIFLRSDLFEILEYARGNNFCCTLLSSGTCNLEGDQLKELRRIQIERLVVSLYSLENLIHDQITGVPGSRAKVCQVVKNCQDLGIRTAFNCMVLSLNCGEVHDIRAYAAREGIPIRFDSEVGPRFDGRSHPAGLALDAEVWGHLWDVIEEEANFEIAAGGCNAGINSCYINPSGEVWPCMDFPISCGSLRDGGDFAQIWHESSLFGRVRHFQERLHKANESLCWHREQANAWRCIPKKHEGERSWKTKP